MHYTLLCLSLVFLLNIAPIHAEPERTDEVVLTRPLLITGCARSGTTYITKLLRNCGLQLDHERLDKDGCVAWQGAFDVNYADWNWNFPHAKIEFQTIFHQVRHPLLVISSLYNASEPLPPPWAHAWEYILNCVPEINREDSTLVKCAKYWYYWNLAAELRAEWTYRVEDIDNVLAVMEQRLGRPLSRKALEIVPRDVNSKPWRMRFKATWQILEQELDPELLNNIKALAVRYGYAIEKEL